MPPRKGKAERFRTDGVSKCLFAPALRKSTTNSLSRVIAQCLVMRKLSQVRKRCSNNSIDNHEVGWFSVRRPAKPIGTVVRLEQCGQAQHAYPALIHGHR